MPAKKRPPSRFSFENQFLKVDLDVAGVAWSVTEKASGVAWRMAQSTEQDVVIEDSLKNRSNRALASSQDKEVQPARNGQAGAYLSLRDLGLGVHLFLDGRSLVVEIERRAEGGPAKVRDLLFPRHWDLPKRPDTWSLWTVGQGALVPATSKSRFHHPEGYSEQDMAWHGAYSRGCGTAAIAETPYDLYIAMSHLPGEAPSTFIHWLPSHSDLRYTRRVRYTFGKELSYVQQAKLYREYAKKQGWFVSLAEKARWNPNVKRLKGAGVVQSDTATRRMRTMSYRCHKFEDQMKWMLELKRRTGLKTGILHIDGWGKFGYDSMHPETLPFCPEAGGAKDARAFREKAREIGWLWGLHDQYIDIYADSPSYHPSRFLIRENGKPNTLNVWAGGLCSHLCFTESLKFVRRNFVEGVKDQYMYHNSASIYQLVEPDAYYLDCFCRINECFNPEHPMSRSENVHYLNECFKTVREEGKKVLLSCEHPKFYGVPNLDFGWQVGHMHADVEVEGGAHKTEPIGIPIPLWHLVFHDAIWSLMFKDYGRILLYGCTASFSIEDHRASEPELNWKLKTCALNELVGFDEMTDFEVRNGGMELESSFSSGVRVTFNPAEKTYRIRGAKGVNTAGFERLPD